MCSVKDWIKENPNEKDSYLPECSLSINNFDEFLEKRKELMKAKILEILECKDMI